MAPTAPMPLMCHHHLSVDSSVDTSNDASLSNPRFTVPAPLLCHHHLSIHASVDTSVDSSDDASPPRTLIHVHPEMVSMGRRRFGTDFQLMFRILKELLFLEFVSVMTVLFVVCELTIADVFAAILGFLPTGWAFLLIGQASMRLLKSIGFWESIKELARAYEYVMGIVIFMPVVVLSWFPFISLFQTCLLFNQPFSRGLQISRILVGRKGSSESTN